MTEAILESIARQIDEIQAEMAALHRDFHRLHKRMFRLAEEVEQALAFADQTELMG